MAITGFTVFITYQFQGGGAYSASTSYGYADAIHCNYIARIETPELTTKGVSAYFPSVNDFPFLSTVSSTTTGYGWSALQFNIIAQIVNGTEDDAIPIANQWKILDVTYQIKNHIIGTPILASGLTATQFGFTQLEYNIAPVYDLSYLNQPNNLSADDNKLTFGEEVFFFGNVKTQIKATAYTTDIPVVLSLNEFNSTTNSTWDSTSAVLINEIGIYDDTDKLVAIGKLNHPISKDSTISRTIVFAMDF